MKGLLVKTKKTVFAFCMVFLTVFCVASAVQAAEVTIVSYATGESGTLRSSQLLEAKVAGYDGDLTQLKYTWENDLRTYLYIYNSPNMYGIKGTVGEIEIPYHNNSGNNEVNPIDYGNGYRWAAVFGDDLSNNSLWGYIKVVVTAPDGSLIGEATHKNGSGKKDGFNKPDLKADLTAVNYAVFEGETISMKGMISRGSIVHADCVSTTIENASRKSGAESITLVKAEGESDYNVTGVKKGVGSLSFTVNKDICKFHSEKTSTVTSNVVVIKKPEISTHLTTLTLSNLDADCEYFVGGKKGLVDPATNTITFTGLDPGTVYEVTIRNEYAGKYAFAYVAETTMSMHKATVNFYTDEELSDTLAEYELGQNLFLCLREGGEYIPLNNESVGVYSANVENGVYFVYYKLGENNYVRIGDHQVTVFNADHDLNIHLFSVEYYDGDMLLKRTHHYEDRPVYIPDDFDLNREDKMFLHWVDESGTAYHHDQLITNAIDEPLVLRAMWVNTIDIIVNIKIDHKNNPLPNEEVALSLISHDDHEVLYHKDLTKNDCDGYEVKTEGNITTYTATKPSFEKVPDIFYNLSVVKDEYSIQTVEAADNETLIYNVTLEYDGVSISAYDITLDGNGGTINGSNTYILKAQTEIPSLKAYVPVREGGYYFKGWFTDAACENPVIEGTFPTGNITLYAGWEEPLSVSGTFFVEGFYYKDNDRFKVPEDNRPKTIEIVLQISHNNEHNDVQSIEAELVFDPDTDIATVNYSFDHLPRPIHGGHSYNIKAYDINYVDTYDNNGDSNYYENESLFLFGNDSSAVVNGKLSFEPELYTQAFKIDATAIGEGFRPLRGITQVLYRSTIETAPHTVIPQHTVPPYGESFVFGDGGVAEGNLDVLLKDINGDALSYQLLVSEIDGTSYDNNAHFWRRYEAPSTSNSPGVLTAVLYPKTYRVNLELGLNEGETVENMDAYLSIDGESYFTVHTWSIDTPVEAAPVREGYVLLGWKAEKEGIYENGKVLASVGENITLQAVWGEFVWTTDTDSGYVETDNGKEAVVRFLFDIETTDEQAQNITKTGIKYIKAGSIGEKVENSTFVGEELTGTATTFYGDITNIPEENKDSKYYAVAYVICNGSTYWSLPVECAPDFTKAIKYE